MTATPPIETIAETICKAMKALYLKNLITALAGNISVRIDSLVLITPSGKLKFALEPYDISIVTIDGKHLSGPKPSSELPMHLAIYRNCSKCRAVVHIHGVLTPFIDRGILENLVYDTELEFFLKPRICTVEKLMPGTIELANTVAKAVGGGCNVVVLQNHGIVAIGRSLEEAMELAESIELAVKRTILLKVLDLFQRE